MLATTADVALNQFRQLMAALIDKERAAARGKTRLCLNAGRLPLARRRLNAAAGDCRSPSGPAKPAPSQRAARAASAAAVPPAEKSNSRTSRRPGRRPWSVERARGGDDPPALPLSRGTELIIRRLLGAENMPKPAPLGTRRHMISRLDGSVGNSAVRTKPWSCW